MDTAILRKIERAEKPSKKDVKFVERYISEARLNAMNLSGYARYLVNRDANIAEEKLKLALDKKKIV
jgi:hypothetical protein